VRIETASRIEAGRQLQPFFGNEIGIENSGVFLNMNAGELGLALDLSTPEAREVVLDLVRWADVVCESFAPGTMDRWDLGYEQLRTVKPDIIMLATTLMGQTGSLKDFAGYGNLSAAICGFYNVTGWSDRLPTGPYVAYTDYVAPRMTLPILLAALDYRRRTGVGQFIDLSQAEASLHFLGPAVLRYSRSGLIPERVGNLDETYAPHGVFPCKGIEQWIAIVIRDSEEWQRLCNQVPDLREFRHLDHQDRRDRNNEIEGILSSWTVMRSRDSLEAELQGLGIPAHGLHASADSARDPQLRTRGHFATTKHALHGDVTVEACRWIFADSQPTSYCAAPTLGQHSYEVLSEILGYDDERIAALFGNDVVS
jgi:benzylsuccinate CoA-transferase BbsF subunit